MSDEEPVKPSPPVAPPPLVEPPARPLPPEIPTQAMDVQGVDDAPAAARVPDAPSPVTAASAPPPAAATAPASEKQGEELDAIFGESAFVEYDEPPRARRTAPPPPEHGHPHTLSRTQAVLLAVTAGLVGILALAALFLFGTRIATSLGLAPAVVSSPTATPTPTPTPTPTATTQPLAPLPPGTYAWDALLGTECVEPFTSAWQEEYTVVDCATPHAAQLVKRGTFPDQGPYPGLDELGARMNLLCTDPTVIDYTLTAGAADLQFTASYAATEQEWAQGHHDYFCFVNRASGAPLTTTIAKPPVPAG